MLIITAHAWDSDDSNPTITIKLLSCYLMHIFKILCITLQQKLRLNFKRGLFLRYN